MVKPFRLPLPAVVLVVLALGTAGLRGQRSSLVQATVDVAHPGRAIPSSFLGFSIEYNSIPRYAGTPDTGMNSVFVQLLQNLSAWDNGPLALRIGGNSEGRVVVEPERQPEAAGRQVRHYAGLAVRACGVRGADKLPADPRIKSGHERSTACRGVCNVGAGGASLG